MTDAAQRSASLLIVWLYSVAEDLQALGFLLVQQYRRLRSGLFCLRQKIVFPSHIGGI